MGPVKAQVDQVVRVSSRPSYFTVVDWKDHGSNRYLCVQTSDEMGRLPHGPALWLKSPDFEPTEHFSRTPGRIYRKNQRLNQSAPRLCRCNCCEHLQAGVNELPAVWLERRGEG